MDDSLAAIIDKIVKHTKEKEEDILKEIEKKEKEFEGLISTLGAAYIVAKEKGIKLNNMELTESKIHDLFAGLGGVRLKAKILRRFPITEFTRKDGSKGRVMNILIGDETGAIRLSLWDEQIDFFKYSEGDVIEIEGAYVREGLNKRKELRVRDINAINKSDEQVEVDESLISMVNSRAEYEKKAIVDLKEGDRVEVEGYIIRLFYKEPLHKYCPVCRAKVDGDYCAVHGKINPEVLVVFSGIVDDGTSSIVFNLFRAVAESFVNMSWSEIDKEINNKGLTSFYEGLNVEMKKYKLKGLVKLNTYSSSLELNVISLKEINIIDNINKNISVLNSS